MSNELWKIESGLLAQGYKTICGVDEAGRGPLAGPVVAAAVVLPFGIEIQGIDDSKKLTDLKRDKLFDDIIDNAIGYSIAFSTHMEIDELNILQATFLAMNRAINGLSESFGVLPDISLIDGNMNKGISFNSIAVVGGDGKSISIAAASILAKVSRDRYMFEMSHSYPQYGFEKHKGYGTKLHYEMLNIHGKSEIHRSSFLKKKCSASTFDVNLDKKLK